MAAAVAGGGLPPNQVTSFAVEYSTSEAFSADSTVRIDGKTTSFLSDRRLDNGTTEGMYETDVTSLQVMFRGVWKTKAVMIGCFVMIDRLR